MPRPTTAPADVQVGQIWKDNDRRAENRYLIIRGIAGDFARCERVDRNGGPVIGRCRREVSICLKRFRPISNGYVLISKGAA